MRKDPRNWLAVRSLDLILEHQSETGAFPASPEFSTYQYSWLRDGAFIAHSLDAYGHDDRAASFHRWVASTVNVHAEKVDRLAESVAAGETTPAWPPSDAMVLHTRFTLAGEEATDAWGNFQLDGYGFWLTGLAHHLARTGEAIAPYLSAVETVVRYLTLTWDFPCYDCWEEYPTAIHSSTLAAVAGGLAVGSRLVQDERGLLASQSAMSKLRGSGVRGAVLNKFVTQPKTAPEVRSSRKAPVAGHERDGRPLPDGLVDASALLVLGEFGPFSPDDSLVRGTLAAIEEQLVIDGGTHRYLEDEYYGGGQWVLLSAALALLHAQHGRAAEASNLIDWVIKQADDQGRLPEQTANVLRHPQMYDGWVDRWGPVSSPLLWSHAMYLLAIDGLSASP